MAADALSDGAAPDAEPGDTEPGDTEPGDTEGAPADGRGGGPGGPTTPAEGWTRSAARVSGLVLLVAVPVLVALTQVFVDPAEDTVPDVRARWEQPGWLVLECLVLVAAAVHVPSTLSLALARRRTARRTAIVAVAVAVAACVAGFGVAVVVSAP